MPKKTLLFIIFLIALVFFPITKVSATQVYVGVQVTATQPAKSSTVPDPGKLWCLPIGTTMTILSGSTSCPNNICTSSCTTGCTILTPIPPTVNPVTTLPTCPGSTIWSGLLNLTSGTVHTIRIVTPAYPFCSGYYYSISGQCYETWEVVGQNKNCTEVCNHYGQTNYSTSCYTYLTNCSAIEKLKGSSCTICHDGASYSYYSKTNNECWYHNNTVANCTWSDPGYVRVCACNQIYLTTAALTFNFSFIP